MAKVDRTKERQAKNAEREMDKPDMTGVVNMPIKSLQALAGIKLVDFETAPGSRSAEATDEPAAEMEGGDPALDELIDQMNLGGNAEKEDTMATPKTKAQITAEEATRVANEAWGSLQTPEEIAEKRERNRARREAEQKRDHARQESERTERRETEAALSILPEGVKLAYLRALQTEFLLANRPERTLNDEERKNLAAAQKPLKTYKSWSPRVRQPFEQGFPLKREVEIDLAELEAQKAEGADPDALEQIEVQLERARAGLAVSVENEELHLGFNAWRQAQEAAQEAARKDRDAHRKKAMTAFYEGTVPLDQAIEQGSGESCVWVEFTAKKRVGDDNRLVPVLDEKTGKPVKRTNLVKIRVDGKWGTVSGKLDENRPPHIHVDPDRRARLNPEEDFYAIRGEKGWHEDMSKALAKAYAECLTKKAEREQLALQQEEMAKIQTFLGAIEDRRTTTVSEVFSALEGKKGRKTGVIVTNNPNLRMDSRNPNSKKFHLAFALSVGAKGVCRLGEWYSSNEGAGLSPLVGRDLVLAPDEKGFMKLTDPDLPSIEGLEGKELEEANASIKRIGWACGRMMGALLAEKSYESRHPAEKAKSEASAKPESAPEANDQSASEE